MIEVLSLCGVKPETAVAFAPLFDEQVEKYGTSKNELAMILANVNHESSHLERRRESLNYAPDQLRKVWPHRFTSTLAMKLGRTSKQKANQHAIAEIVYGNRMGNRAGTSDAYDYRGGGINQLTGFDNYKRMQQLTGHLIVEEPDLIVQPSVAVDVCFAWYYDDAKLVEYGKNGDFHGVCGVWNAGAKIPVNRIVGYDDRFANYMRARIAFNL